MAADDAMAADGAMTDDDGLARRGGGAAVHCTGKTPAAIMATSTATHRLKDVNWDESSPLAPTSTMPPRSGSADKSAATASGVNYRTG